MERRIVEEYALPLKHTFDYVNEKRAKSPRRSWTDDQRLKWSLRYKRCPICQEKWAKENEIPCTIIKPDWAKYGKGAGIKRNKQIIESCDQCLAFWDGNSKGTASGIKLAEQLKKPIHLILYNTN